MVKLDFHFFSTTRGNKLKLQIFNCHYVIRKYLFGSRLYRIVYQIALWRLTLFMHLRIVLINTVVIKIVYDYKSDLTGTCFCLCLMLCYLRCGQRRSPCARNITLNWIGFTSIDWLLILTVTHRAQGCRIGF